MNFFDLHCDTAGECFLQKKQLADSDLNISLCKGEALDKWAQLFAVWIPDELRGEEACEYFDKVSSGFIEQINMNSSKIKLCKDLNDFNEAILLGKCAAFLTVEGGSAVCGEGRLEALKQFGVKLVTLTWNLNNEIGGGCQDDEKIGFTQTGKQVLSELSRLNIIADVSHLGKKCFYELFDGGYDMPIIASHSDCSSVLLSTRAESEDREFSLRRSLDDEQIKLLIERKSLIGINFCRSFLGDYGDDGFEAVYRHIEHILSLGGENCVAVGSDFDGCDINPELDSLDKIPDLRAFLAGKGYSDALLEKIFYNNAAKFFINVLQNG